jgi:hypothetical protein
MAYCVEADVEGLTALAIDTTSKPSSIELLTIIASIAAEIDGVLKAVGYTTPATGVNDVALLRNYNCLGASYRAWHAAVRGTDRFPNVESWEKDYRDFLARIRKGEQSLIDQTLTDGLPSALGTIALKKDDGYSQASGQSEYDRQIIYIQV